ncbi:DUF6221 family protein [Streptomyces sp. NPDC057806]|uniref:DUF6221 family protein n=1 Tax=Streptomyces sp. NPDC057806 TaxID=3346255 RepID=UPI0036A27D9D
MSGHDLVTFVATRLADEVDSALRMGNMLVTQHEALGMSLEVAEKQARLQLHTAEMRQALFVDTVRPYLGTAGPTGRIAEQQLRMLAAMNSGHPDYRPEWRPQ